MDRGNSMGFGDKIIDLFMPTKKKDSQVIMN